MDQSIQHLDSASGPGNARKESEDAHLMTTRAALVINGATGIDQPLFPGEETDASVRVSGVAARA